MMCTLLRFASYLESLWVDEDPVERHPLVFSL